MISRFRNFIKFTTDKSIVYHFIDLWWRVVKFLIISFPLFMKYSLTMSNCRRLYRISDFIVHSVDDGEVHVQDLRYRIWTDLRLGIPSTLWLRNLRSTVSLSMLGRCVVTIWEVLDISSSGICQVLVNDEELA